MIAVQILLSMAVLAGGDECSCSCNELDVCEEQSANAAEIQKWNKHYNFLRDWAKDWHNQVAHVARQQLEVELNETLDSLKNAYQKEEDLIAKFEERLENSVRTLNERVDELDSTMEMISDQMSRIELHLTQLMCSPPCENGGQCMTNNTCQCTISFAGDRCQQAVCSPPCENGGECLKNNFCSCPTAFTGDRCQEGGPKCGVDFNNGGGNTSSVLVWPWMAAVYSDNIHVCGGSVIHRHFVLTSAGCVDAYYGISRLSVKLGLSDLKTGTHLREHRVQSTHEHPQFKTGSNINYDYDIALLELEDPIPFGPFVRPVCLPPPEIPQGEPFYKPQSTAKAVDLLDYLSSPQTASPTVFNLTVLSREECRRILKERDWEKRFPSPDLSFCTESSPPTCPRIGSPVMESRVEGGGTRTWTQVGIQSWLFSSCQYIFSPRLDQLRAWVDATIAASSKR